MKILTMHIASPLTFSGLLSPIAFATDSLAVVVHLPVSNYATSLFRPPGSCRDGNVCGMNLVTTKKER